MRIKSDFITNSSSASFLVAINRDATKDALKEVFAPSVKKYFEQCMMKDEYALQTFNEETWDDESHVATEEDVLEFIVSNILDEVKGGLELGDWVAISREYGSEDSGTVDNFMYSYFDIKDNEVIKVSSYC